jgi:hypothetical protein
MKVAVFNLTALNEGAINCNSLLALFLSETLKIPVWGDSKNKATGRRGGEELLAYQPDTLFVINGLMHHCHAQQELAAVIRKAKQVIWVVNDYHLEKPSHNTKSSASPVLVAIREALDRGLNLDFWTTVPHYTERSEFSKLIHWDYLFYNRITPQRPKVRNLLYYGAMRTGRVKTFDRFFSAESPDVTVMTNTTQNERWLERYPHLQLAPPVPHHQLADAIGAYSLGLYLQDEVRFFVNPAARFYEMLGAGLPMVFQEEAVPRFEAVGIDIRPYVLEDVDQIEYFLKRRSKIFQAQQAWHQSYHQLLRKEVLKAWDKRLTVGAR